MCGDATKRRCGKVDGRQEGGYGIYGPSVWDEKRKQRVLNDNLNYDDLLEFNKNGYRCHLTT